MFGTLFAISAHQGKMGVYMGRLPSSSLPHTPGRLLAKMTSCSSLTLNAVDKAFSDLGLSRSDQPTTQQIHRAYKMMVRARNMFVLACVIQQCRIGAENYAGQQI